MVQIGAGRRIPAVHPVLRYRGAVHLRSSEGVVTPWRVPFHQARLYLPDGAVGRMAMPCGVRICFRTDSRWLGLHYTARKLPADLDPPEVPQVDVLCDGKLIATVDLRTDGAAHFVVPNLPGLDSLIELWLPHSNQFSVEALVVADDATLAPDRTEPPKWISYGGSTAQGRGAGSPSRSWPALVAQSAGLDLTSLAVPLNCNLQPMFARLIRDLPADLVSCQVGVADIGRTTPAHFAANLVGFVQIIRERHPEVPIVVMSPTHVPPLEAGGVHPVHAGDFRDSCEKAVRLLWDHGDRNVHHLDGRAVFGPADEHLLLESPGPDQLHPNPEGHVLLAERFRDYLSMQVLKP